ncbi:hypothetical protein FQN54_003547 [Arachnomyces sp. PD_36]|nr:hypothetical protein FQN54_003547 [Arachnomyces sp. PD_36]
MRPPRLILLLLCFIFLPILLTFLSLLSAHPQGVNPADSSLDGRSGRLRSFFSFHAPSALFPPSAVISLTDDNSTFFLARPAAFGPLLPEKGLSGQLWIGSGFGDDTPRKGGATTGAEGELGCSDVPGWDEGDNKHPNPGQGTSKTSLGDSAIVNPPTIPGKGDAMAVNRRRSVIDLDSSSQASEVVPPSDADGTDDHLHHPLPESYFPDTKSGSSGNSAPLADNKAPVHADIQSLQEAAEIAGKVVLLSRGGCGFLEKVKWVQRRGGTALIVGDDTRGGGLVTMYARGDTSNVTIPALFTSHTTAHLLSSLIPPGNAVDATNVEDTTKSTHGDSYLKTTPSKGKSSDGHGTTLTKTGSKAASTPRSVTSSTKSNSESSPTKSNVGWLRSLLSPIGLGSNSDSHLSEDTRRPPSSGHIDWVLLDDWEEDSGSSKTKKPYVDDSSRQSEDTKSQEQSKKPTSHQSGDDNFVIGVQDWRDPDLIAPPTSAEPKPTGILEKLISRPQEKESTPEKSTDSTVNSPKGGSITPGSGEYVDPGKSADGKTNSKSSSHTSNGPSDARPGSSSHEESWWSSHFSWSGSKSSDGVPTKEDAVASKDGKTAKTPTSSGKAPVTGGDEEEEHEGLWVTLTPTNISASPFFDTLLVLVVSPLVTLTVVYALLLLRSRIRRRRWRAPKSVVDRLPVRTYQTMASSPPSPTTSQPAASETSPTSPLLPSTSQPISTRPRPRSQTFSGLFAAWPGSPESRPHAEKNISASQPQRSRYTGRQIECVVCLEEYVEGQSRVMSLPCGHEFHVECITPWLTTRRRTCPICKGDVVRPGTHRSLGRDNRGERADDVQSQAAETRNDSPSSAIPIDRPSEDADSDLEQGEASSTMPLLNTSSTSAPPQSSWRNFASFSLSALSGDTIWHQAHNDRNR